VLGSYHPNTVLVELSGSTRTVKLLASSLGGGKVEVQEFNDYPLKFSGERPTLVIRHHDKKGIISELLCMLSQSGLDIARMANERSKINGAAITICEIDNHVDESFLTSFKKEVPLIDEIIQVETM
jgi:L-serine dehydratase